MKSVDASDAAINMYYGSRVIVVPGYGLAVAQAQHKLCMSWLVKLLQKQGVVVSFAIHPVAGRMPGHMNVLLAEAGIPYDIIYDLEDINEEFLRGPTRPWLLAPTMWLTRRPAATPPVPSTACPS